MDYYFNQSVLEQHRNDIYFLVRFLMEYAVNADFHRIPPGRVIDTSTTSVDLAERNDCIVRQITVVKTIEVPKGENSYSAFFANVPSSISALAKDWDISRQTLANFKELFERLRDEGCLKYSLGNSYTVLNDGQLNHLLGNFAAAPQIEARNKSLYLALFMIVSINFFKGRFSRTYQKISEDTGLNLTFVKNTIKDLVDNNVIAVDHRGNAVTHLGSTYSLTDYFKEM